MAFRALRYLQTKKHYSLIQLTSDVRLWAGFLNVDLEFLSVV
jgi:hypothetical protein